jgi:hypothetical protein
MPRTNYVPDMHRPVGYAMAYLTERAEDKPTVEVDMFAEGMVDGLIEAVCMALELWNPVFSHWEDPPPSKDTDTRRIPVFRGAHADKVLKFREDVQNYVSRHPLEQDKNKFLRIASKYVHLRPMPREGDPRYPHFNTTPYARDVIRPYIRRSDPEWVFEEVVEARQHYFVGDEPSANKIVVQMLKRYDRNHDSGLADTYNQELVSLIRENAPLWEFWRLIAYYVQDICDAQYQWAEEGLFDTYSAALDYNATRRSEW